MKKNIGCLTLLIINLIVGLISIFKDSSVKEISDTGRYFFLIIAFVSFWCLSIFKDNNKDTEDIEKNSGFRKYIPFILWAVSIISILCAVFSFSISYIMGIIFIVIFGLVITIFLWNAFNQK
jgi:uncharacterized membrane protein YiaA